MELQLTLPVLEVLNNIMKMLLIEYKVNIHLMEVFMKNFNGI